MTSPVFQQPWTLSTHSLPTGNNILTWETFSSKHYCATPWHCQGNYKQVRSWQSIGMSVRKRTKYNSHFLYAGFHEAESLSRFSLLPVLDVSSIRIEKLCQVLLRRVGILTRKKGSYFQNGITVLISKFCANQAGQAWVNCSRVLPVYLTLMRFSKQ